MSNQTNKYRVMGYQTALLGILLDEKTLPAEPDNAEAFRAGYADYGTYGRFSELETKMHPDSDDEYWDDEETEVRGGE